MRTYVFEDEQENPITEFQTFHPFEHLVAGTDLDLTTDTYQTPDDLYLRVQQVTRYVVISGGRFQRDTTYVRCSFEQFDDEAVVLADAPVATTEPQQTMLPEPAIQGPPVHDPRVDDSHRDLDI